MSLLSSSQAGLSGIIKYPQIFILFSVHSTSGFNWGFVSFVVFSLASTGSVERDCCNVLAKIVGIQEKN